MVPLIVFVIIIVIVLLLLIWYISTANHFARIAVKIKESESGIDVALTKRYSVLTKMLDVCREFSAHETAAFAKVIALRQGMSIAERQAADAQMTEMTGKINLLAEAYPELKSSAVFVELQKGIRDVEEHLQAARRFYNANVSEMNQALAVYPQSIVGKQKGYVPYEFYQAEEQHRKDVKMTMKTNEY